MSPPSAEFICSFAAFKDFVFAPQAILQARWKDSQAKLASHIYNDTLRQHLTALKVHITEAFLSCAQRDLSQSRPRVNDYHTRPVAQPSYDARRLSAGPRTRRLKRLFLIDAHKPLIPCNLLAANSRSRQIRSAAGFVGVAPMLQESRPPPGARKPALPSMH